MIKTHLIPAILLLAAATAPAATVFSTDFDSLPDGSVTNAVLNTATTGGIWYLNPNRGASYEIQDSSGDKALLLDDPDNTGNNGVIQFAGITLGTTIDLTTDAVTWDFRAATRRTGTDKGLRFEFYATGGVTVAATIDWFNDGSVSLNAGEDSGSSAFTFLNPWNAASSSVRDVSVTFSGSAVSVDFGGESLVGTVQNSVTDIQRFRVYSIGSSGQARGLFLDDITATTTAVPEPSVAVVATVLLGMGVLRRRR